MRLAAGIGDSQTFTLTFKNGIFVWIFDAKWANGVGIGGKISGEMSPTNIDKFFTILLAVMQEKGFKRFNFYDEKKDETYKALNGVITVYIGMGLSIGEAMLLPFTLLSKMESKVLDKNNRYFVANFINSKEDKDKAANSNIAPAKAILTIFKWLEHQIIQFLRIHKLKGLKMQYNE